MIYTVTFNPAIDYVIKVDNLTLGQVNRTTREYIFCGGKGINVSHLLANLGVDSVGLGFIAGFTGDVIESGAKELGFKPGEATVGKILDALKRMGADYVFDTCFSADLTIMEEGTEFIQRFTSGELKDRPMFTSCCPGWLRFAKSQFPHLVKYLSSAKSPQQMFGAVMKTYFAQKLGVKPEQIFTVSVMHVSLRRANRKWIFL